MFSCPLIVRTTAYVHSTRGKLICGHWEIEVFYLSKLIMCVKLVKSLSEIEISCYARGGERDPVHHRVAHLLHPPVHSLLEIGVVRVREVHVGLGHAEKPAEWLPTLSHENRLDLDISVTIRDFTILVFLGPGIVKIVKNPDPNPVL